MKRDNSKLYIWILAVFILLMITVAASALLIMPEIYEKECRTRVNTELEANIDDSVLSSNICVVKFEETSNGNTTTFSYSLGASGVIFDKRQDIYYAITAYHVVSDFSNDNVKFLIQPYNSLSYSQSNQGGGHLSLEDYYGQFPSAKVEYYEENCDLAVISFYYPHKLGILDISEADTVKGTEIAVISNPEGERFIHTFGSILSDEPIAFSGNDEQSTNMAIRHNAYVAPGSSGSPVLSFANGKAVIVGINIGGGTNFMGKFQYGAMIPGRQIVLFLDNWKGRSKP